MKEVYTTKYVAEKLGMCEQGVREQIKRGNFKFGYAVKGLQGNKLHYIIPKEKFDEFMGKKNESI